MSKIDYNSAITFSKEGTILGSSLSEKKKFGLWIRPDEELGGSSYSKLIFQNEYDDAVYSWQSEDKMFGLSDKSKSSYALNYRPDIMEWLIQKSPSEYTSLDYVPSKQFDRSKILSYENCIPLSRQYMIKEAHAVSEECHLFDLSWVKLHTLETLFSDSIPGKDIVWRLQKHYTHDGNRIVADNIEQTIYLDQYEQLNDGSDKWFTTSIKVNCTDDFMRYYEEKVILDSLTRQKMKKPCQTTQFVANIPSMFYFSSKIRGLYCAEHLLLTYIVNSPLEIKYVLADAISREDYQKILDSEKSTSPTWGSTLYI